jgi:hypothetical protein
VWLRTVGGMHPRPLDHRRALLDRATTITHEGRRVRASPEELNCWLGREVSEPVQIALPNPLIPLQS